METEVLRACHACQVLMIFKISVTSNSTSLRCDSTQILEAQIYLPMLVFISRGQGPSRLASWYPTFIPSIKTLNSQTGCLRFPTGWSE